MLVGRPAHRLPRPTTRAGATSTRSTATARRPAPPHRPRRPRRARLLRPARQHRRRRGSSTSPRASCGSSTRSDPERPAPARRPARRAAHRPRAVPRHHVRAAHLGRAGPHRPRRASRSSAAPCTGSPTATARPATLLAEPGVRARLAAAAGRRTGRCGSTTPRARTRCASPRSTSAPTDAPPRRRYGAGELGRVLELARGPGRPRVALATARRAAAASSTRHRRVARAGPRRRRRDLRPALVARQRVARLLRPGRVRAEPDHDGPAGRRHAGRGHRAAVRRRRPGVHRGRQVPGVPVPAQLRPDLRRARLRPDLPGVLAAVPGAAGRAHAVAVRGQPGRASGVAAGRGPDDLPAPDPTTPPTEDADERPEARQGQGERQGAAGGRRRRRGAGRPGGADPGRRGPLRRHGRGKDCLLWYRSPVAGVLGDGRAGTDDKPRAAGAGALRPGPPQARRDRRPGERLRGERRRHPAGRARREHPAGAAHRPARLRRRRSRGRAPTSSRSTPGGSWSPSTRPPSGGRCSTRPAG